jgi:hypothetical protein
MAKNKHVDLFKDMIPAVDMGLRELWDAATEEGQKEIKNDLWNLNRYISSVKTSNREIQEHFILTVNEYYNKDWAAISKHPKLQWMTLCMCSHDSKKTFFHEWLSLKKQIDRKEEILSDLFPSMKIADVRALSKITTKQEIIEYCEGLGWDKPQISKLKL